MILMLKVKLMFLNVFLKIPSKHFHYFINIVVISAPAREFLSTKSAQFPLAFTE